MGNQITTKPSHGYVTNGISANMDEPAWPYKAQTRSEARYCILWMSYPKGGSCRCCYPTIQEAISYAEEHKAWKPLTIMDMRKNRVRHSFVSSGAIPAKQP